MTGAPVVISGGGSGGGSTITVDTLANIEAAAAAAAVGDIGYPTDSPYELRCAVAGAWTYYHPAFPGVALTKPPTAGWSWDNQSTCTASTVGGKLRITSPHGVTLIPVYKRAAPATPWTITIGMMFGGVAGKDNLTLDCGFYEAGTGKMIRVAVDCSGSKTQITAQNWNNSTTFTGTIVLGFGFDPRPVMFRLANDGANITASISYDGSTFQALFTEAKNAHFTAEPDSVWVSAYANNTAVPNLSAINDIIHWAAT